MKFALRLQVASSLQSLAPTDKLQISQGRVSLENLERVGRGAGGVRARKSPGADDRTSNVLVMQ